MGFSAGGAPVMGTALRTQRMYEPVDEYDDVSFRPDFAAPIYSAPMPPDAELSEDSPPFFMATAHDDFNPLDMAKMYIALNEANISAELHIYESGGHGYGLRRTDLPVTSWNDRMEDWMRKLKLLELD
jgi:acetyl esterase/lipase